MGNREAMRTIQRVKQLEKELERARKPKSLTFSQGYIYKPKQDEFTWVNRNAVT